MDERDSVQASFDAIRERVDHSLRALGLRITSQATDSAFWGARTVVWEGPIRAFRLRMDGKDLNIELEQLRPRRLLIVQEYPQAGVRPQDVAEAVGAWLADFLRPGEREIQIAAWAQGLDISGDQRAVMEQLWVALKVGVPPLTDPLQGLTEERRSHLLQLCREETFPRRLGREKVGSKIVLHDQLQARGFTSPQAAVLAGMIFNCLGPVDWRTRRRLLEESDIDKQ